MIKTIHSTEYANSRQRLSALEEIVVDGRDAEAIMKYADRIVEITEAELLDACYKRKDVSDLTVMYQVARRFKEMLIHAVEQGKAKEQTYNNLRKEII